MSTQADIFGFMTSLSPDEKGYIPATAAQIALQTGFSRDKVNKTLFNLSHTGRIELLRGPNGRDIIGYKVLRSEVATRGRRAGTKVVTRLAQPQAVRGAGPGRPRTSLATPYIDSYAEAKARFEKMKTDFGELVEASFKENVYAEEGLRIKDRLVVMESRVIDLQQDNADMERELRFLRGKKNQEMTEAAMVAGATVVHGD